MYLVQIWVLWRADILDTVNITVCGRASAYHFILIQTLHFRNWKTVAPHRSSRSCDRTKVEAYLCHPLCSPWAGRRRWHGPECWGYNPWVFFTFMWPCIVTNFFIIKPTRCTNFTNLFWHETLPVSESSSVHHQEFIHCTLSNGVCHTGL